MTIELCIKTCPAKMDALSKKELTSMIKKIKGWSTNEEKGRAYNQSDSKCACGLSFGEAYVHAEKSKENGKYCKIMIENSPQIANILQDYFKSKDMLVYAVTSVKA